MSKLAVIIPAYKKIFLRKSLLSLAGQTSQNFTVYIGDDNSPDKLKSICDEFGGVMNLVYHRFEDNLGKIDLVAHWERCVKLIQNEEWIWIFSDDDTLEEGCVKALQDVLVETKEFFDVYRFNTCVIDEMDNIIGEAEPSPQIEDAINLAYNILLRKRGNSMPDHIFKRSAYVQYGGVVNFIQAQASDWATSIKYAYNNGLYTISGPRVRWRLSATNVSATANKNSVRLLYGHLQFIEWILNFFNIADEANSNISLTDLKKASKYNLYTIIRIHYKGVPFRIFLSVARRISSIYNTSILYGVLFCLKINYETFKSNLKK